MKKLSTLAVDAENNLKMQHLSVRSSTQHYSAAVSDSGNRSFLDKVTKTKTMIDDTRPSALNSRKDSVESLHSQKALRMKTKRKTNLTTEHSIDSLKDIERINQTLNESRLAPELEYAHLIGKAQHYSPETSKQQFQKVEIRPNQTSYVARVFNAEKQKTKF